MCYKRPTVKERNEWHAERVKLKTQVAYLENSQKHYRDILEHERQEHAQCWQDMADKIAMLEWTLKALHKQYGD